MEQSQVCLGPGGGGAAAPAGWAQPWHLGGSLIKLMRIPSMSRLAFSMIPLRKFPFFSLSHTHRFISDPHSNPGRLRELKGLAQGDTINPTQAQVSWFPGPCAQNVVFWLAEVSG